MRAALARPRRVTSGQLSGAISHPRCADAEARSEPYTPILHSHGQRAQSKSTRRPLLPGTLGSSSQTPGLPSSGVGSSPEPGRDSQNHNVGVCGIEGKGNPPLLISSRLPNGARPVSPSTAG